MTPRSDTLHIADGLELDADYAAAASFGILAKRGAGKTYTGRVLGEELFAAQVPVVVVDPAGAWWGLRSSADGERDGLPLPIFGGQHGDVPLEPTAGALMADLVVNEGLSMILDLKGFGSRAQEQQFATDFFDRIFRRNRDLVHLLIDEADLFAPQKPLGKQDAELLETVENIVRRGRNHGIGVTLISQRSAVLNKNVLSQIDGLVALRTPASQDRAAIRAWVHGQGDDDRWTEVAPSLPSLANGESWWWIPELDILRRVQVRETWTFDSSPNRRRDQRGREPKTFADVDLHAISGQITSTIERAREADPQELRRRIAVLERELRDRDRQLVEERAARQAPAPIEALDPKLVERLERAVAGIGHPDEDIAEVGTNVAAQLEQSLGKVADRLTAAAREVTTVAGEVTTALREHGSAYRQQRLSPPDELPRPAPRATTPRPASATSIPPARQRILDALANLESIGVPQSAKIQLALWAGVSPKSSGYQNNLGALRSLGLIDYPQPGHVALTADGRAMADTSVAATLTTTEALHIHVRNLLPPARWRIVDALIRIYPDSLSKAELATVIDVSPNSSGYQNNLGKLRSLGLIDYPQPGHVVAARVLFINHYDAG